MELIHLFKKMLPDTHWNKNHLFPIPKISQNQHPMKITTESQMGRDHSDQVGAACFRALDSGNSQEGDQTALRSFLIHHLLRAEWLILLKVAVLSLYSRAVLFHRQ